MSVPFKSFVGHRVRELCVHLNRWRQAGHHPRLCVLPSETGGSSLLWGQEMALALRQLGWRVTVLHQVLELVQRRRIIARERPAALLMIKARNAMNRPRLYGDVPVVFVLDDADYLDLTHEEAVIECCRGSKAVVAGSRVVEQWCQQHSDNVSMIWVSHPIPKKRAPTRCADRRPIVGWAHANPATYPTEAAWVQKVLIQLAQHTRFEFWLWGVREAKWADEYLEPIRGAGVTTRTFGLVSPYSRYIETLQNVAVGLHPICLEVPYSQGKSWGKILSYMAADVAVVTPPVLDHVEVLRDGVNSMLPESVDQWVAAIRSLLLDYQLRQQIATKGYEDFVEHLSTLVAARQLQNVLHSVIPSRAQSCD